MTSRLNNSTQNQRPTSEYWTKEDDKQLLEFVNVDKISNWKSISKEFLNKTPRDCFLRYIRIESRINKKKFDIKEDQKILELVHIYGKNWIKISKFFPNRNHRHIIERFINKLDPGIYRS